MEKALHRKKLYTRAIHHECYIQQGAAHKVGFYMKRSYALRGVTHREELRIVRSTHVEELHTTIDGVECKYSAAAQ